VVRSGVGMIRGAQVAVMTAACAVPFAGSAAAAQDSMRDAKGVVIPSSAMPPAGMCRVWLPGVAERQQPAATDCGTAVRTMPRDATILFGDLQKAGRVSNGGNAATSVPRGAVRAGQSVAGYRGPTLNQVAPLPRPVAPGNVVRGVTAVGATQPTAIKVDAPKAAVRPPNPPE